MKLKYIITGLPLLTLTLVVVTSCTTLPLLNTERGKNETEGTSGLRHRPKVVNVPEKRQIPQSEEWEVVKVSDGDTITVRRGSRKERIRFCGIDSPEKNQRLGSEATDNLRRLIAEGSGRVQLTIIESDRYGRKVAEVFTVLGNGEERFLQEQQLLAGLAYHYAKYSDNCPNRDSIVKAEAIAQNSRIGVWNGSHIKPWDYRKKNR